MADCLKSRRIAQRQVQPERVICLVAKNGKDVTAEI